MATSDYLEKLNAYQTRLVSVASVAAHLLDLVVDDRDVPDWQSAACWLMRDELQQLAQDLPFPNGEQQAKAEVQG